MRQRALIRKLLHGLVRRFMNQGRYVDIASIYNPMITNRLDPAHARALMSIYLRVGRFR